MERTPKIPVLFVDDLPAILDISKIFLEESGDLDISTADSGKAALEALQTCKFDVIVSDYQMSGMNGFQLLHEVRSQYGTIPFILFTGKERDEIIIEALKNGVDSYIYKGGDPTAQFFELEHRIKFHAAYYQLAQDRSSADTTFPIV
ncbi:MAG: response regulator [Methanoregula sp.]|nr:response regulator [Methanoregula sp.]